MELPSNFKEITLESDFDNLNLSLLLSLPEDADPKAIIQISHGMAEHKERYIGMMRYLSELGYACVINDHRGHGKSVMVKEDLGFWYSGGYVAIVEDLLKVTKYVKSLFPNKKVFLVGHSMGSLVARSFIKRYDSEIDGLVVSGSPSYNPALGLARFLAKSIIRIKGERFRSVFLDNLVFGSYSKKIKESTSKFSWLSTDKSIVEEYEACDLCGFIFTANGFENLFMLTIDAYSPEGWVQSKPNLPVLFISGEYDPCHAGKKNFLRAVNNLNRAGYPNVAYKLYPGMRHEIFNEREKLKVWKEMADMLDKFMASF